MTTILGSQVFPYKSHQTRLENYEHYNKLLHGSHFDAFNVSAGESFGRRYSRLRYVVSNFAGIISKVSADTLFGEKITIEAGENDEFIEALVSENNLQVQLYESSLKNSALGDDVFKVRVEDGEIKVHNLDPSMYFPHINPRSAGMTPDVEELAWIETHGEGDSKEAFLVREIYMPQQVVIRVFRLESDEAIKNVIKEEIEVEQYNAAYNRDFEAVVETGIDKNLLVHSPNFRYRGDLTPFGDSDYTDIESLQFALNNRITKVDNILDKHSDPILSVPPGVLDENGHVRKEALQMVEVGDDGKVPEYVVWNANLDAAFDEIDKLIEMLFMTSETSPDVLGMGKGQAESGRALKMRLIRTLAKRNRKRKYYDRAIKQICVIAQELSVANGFTVDGIRASEVIKPTIKWPDGVVDDETEMIENEIKRVEAGLQSKQAAIQTLDKSTMEKADEKLQVINSETGDFTSITDTTNFDN